MITLLAFTAAIVVWGTAYIGNFLDGNKKREIHRSTTMQAQLSIYGNNENSIKDLMREFPDRIEVMVRWIELAVKRRDFEEALKRAETTRKNFPKHEIGYIKCVELLLHCRKKQDAEDLLKQAMKRLGNKKALVRTCGQFYFNIGDYKMASKYFRDLRRIDLLDRDGFVGGSQAEEALGHHDVAENLLQAAIEGSLASNDEKALIRYAEYAHARGSWLEAARRWAILCERKPFSVTGYLRSSEALRNADQWQEAERIMVSAEVLFHTDAKIAAEAILVRDHAAAINRVERLLPPP